MKYLSLLALALIQTAMFADDVFFISPQWGQQSTNPLVIQIHPPFDGHSNVKVTIKRESGWDKVVWRGQLTPQNNYTVSVDTSKFRPGEYEIEASYWMGLEKFDGDIEVWINHPNMQHYND